MRPHLDKESPSLWQSATDYSSAVKQAAEDAGISAQESEYIKVRSSQLNGCAFCLELHSRQARQAGIPQQKLDLVPAWRRTDVFTSREQAMLAIAEAVTSTPLTASSEADLNNALELLGADQFAAAEWIAVTINMFNRISILSDHKVRPRDENGKVIRS